VDGDYTWSDTGPIRELGVECYYVFLIEGWMVGFEVFLGGEEDDCCYVAAVWYYTIVS
jgi:hypothetical protein